MPPANAPSPMLAQWFAAKENHPDALLFFRMGDFFELFFEDAERAAPALDIALTTRGEHAGKPIPMCGVPAANAEPYLARLIRRGFRIAIVEQTETPEQARARGHRGPLPRAVVRVVTPGTVTEEALLEPDRPSWVAAAALGADGMAGLAWLDISTGAFACRSVPARDLAGAVGALEPAELLVAEEAASEPALAPWRNRLVALPGARFRPEPARRALEEAYGVRTLEGFGAFSEAELAAAGAVLGYVRTTQAGKLPLLAPLSREAGGTTMAIDAATRKSLELGAGETGLLRAIDRTVTAAGARLLAARIASPSTLVGAIAARHDAAGFFLADAAAREDIRVLLRRAPDMARALGRLGLGRGAARDLAAIRDGLGAAAAIGARLAACLLPRPSLLADAEAGLDPAPALAGRLSLALVPAPPVKASESGAVASGFDAALDAARGLRDDSRRVVAGLEAAYRAATGIPNLKLRHTAQLGYFAEVPEAAGLALREASPPPLPGLAHRQTMAGTMRFITTELAELDARIVSAASEAEAREAGILAELAAAVRADARGIAAAAEALAAIDVAAATAVLAEAEGWTRPEITEGRDFVVEDGRHPVVEAAVRAEGGAFVANGADLSPGTRLWLITGPNMAGKSTYLRQNALIAILAQAGLFVPARAARIGVVDRLFSRVGASDDLARGRSTFMVEMVETAAILNLASPSSLVILDEIGRGTATWDGLAIAWSVLEALHDRLRCRALFATHFHELTALSGKLPELRLAQFGAREWRGEVVFLHALKPGAADRSWGIAVARLAGLPREVTARAAAVLAALEERARGLTPLAEELPLFAGAPKAAQAGPREAAFAALVEANPDAMSPLEAHALLVRLKSLL
ncbi:DNA mismatch repair protein MutS [Elioraea rosea]|uniref:DNA mismatch repair protein MutS n=1 Tax=Elioraea rosea TaxID=2492390 RepID=UPI001EF6EC10|nr:DNA mismatch repair protein MutS [Elioraea rosea]